jgi:hypothetical protein
MALPVPIAMPCMTMPPSPDIMPPPAAGAAIGAAAGAAAAGGGAAALAGRAAGGGGAAPRAWVEAGTEGRAGGGACLATGRAAPVRREGGILVLVCDLLCFEEMGVKLGTTPATFAQSCGHWSHWFSRTTAGSWFKRLSKGQGRWLALEALLLLPGFWPACACWW